MRVFSVVCCLLLLLAGCVQPGVAPASPEAAAPGTQAPPSAAPAPPAVEIPADFSAYDTDAFRIRFPPDWEVESIGELIAFVSPLEGEGDFRENINVLVAPLPEESARMSAEELIEASFDSYRESIEGFQLLEVGETTLGGQRARKLVYSGTSQGVPLTYEQIVAVKDGTAYSLTYAGHTEKFAEMEPQLAAVAASFALSGAEPAAPEPASPTPAATPSPSPSPAPAGAADVVGNWRVYPSNIYYDSGGRDSMAMPTSRQLEIRADHTWSFGPSNGTWEVKDLVEADWARWQTQPYGPTRKLVLYGWNTDFGDGPLEESGDRVDFFWMIYRTGPPITSRAGQVQMKFGHANA